MDIQHFLAINVSVITALTLAASLIGGQRLSFAWIGVNGIVLAATVAAMAGWPDAAGTIGLMLFVPFILGPLVLTRMAQVRMGQRRLKQAASLARAAVFLHPATSARFFADVVSAQAAGSAGEQKAALAEVAGRYGPAEEKAVKALMLRMDARWDELLSLFDREPELLASMPAVKIRALGETGRLDQMTRAYDDAKSRLNGQALFEAQLVLLAFAGRPIEVETLLAGPLRHYDGEYKLYWGAIARRGAGFEEQHWRPVFEQLARVSEVPATREAARRALISGERGQMPLDEVSAVIVDECADRLHRSDADNSGARFAPVTWLLLAAIAAVYALTEMYGGSQNMRTLVEFGAMWPPYVLQRGEWWRLVAALFLHWGLLHAAVNCFMLFVLGRLCERLFGSLRVAVLYLAGGIASSGFVLWLSTIGEPAVLVGASGAIMSLFGALLGRSIVTWLRSRDSLDGRNLVMLGLIALLQVAADLATPQVSLAAHASGFVAGCILGTLLTLLTLMSRRR